MKIEMQNATSFQKLSYSSWDVCFIGEAIDDRGTEAHKFAIQNSQETVFFSYNPFEFNIKWNEVEYNIDEIDSLSIGYAEKKIIIDSTTIGLAEVLILLQSLHNNAIDNFSILYLEPGDYKKKQKDKVLHRRDFELSEEVSGYIGIPGHVLALTNDYLQKVIFISGYESERMERALEDLYINPSYCQVIFGVPAFQLGWEMNSFSNNIHVIKERNLKGGINFCGATNPLAVYSKLNEIFSGLNDDEQMFIVPIGTKPMGIGATLFKVLIADERIAILYDHPSKKKDRSFKISAWHLYNIFINE